MSPSVYHLNLKNTVFLQFRITFGLNLWDIYFNFWFESLIFFYLLFSLCTCSPHSVPFFFLRNFSKFTLQITLPTAHNLHFLLLPHPPAGPFLPVQNLAHATTSKLKFFYLVLHNSYLTILFNLIHHIIRKFFLNFKDVLPLLNVIPHRFQM